MALTDNFDSYSTGNLAGQGGWTLEAGNNWTVENSVSDTSPNAIVSNDGNFKRNLHTITGVASGVQRFRVLVNPVGTAAADNGGLKINLRETGTRKGGWWIIVTTDNANFKIQLIDGAEVGTDLPGGTGLVANTWYTVDIGWDSVLGLRGRFNVGTWTSYVSPGTFSVINQIELQDASATQGNYLDSFSDGSVTTITNSNFFFFMPN